MVKSELIQAVADKHLRIPVKDVARVINATLDVIRDELIADREVNLLGFGKFSVKERAARKGRNPRTGEVINLPSTKRPHFQAGKAFKQAVNHD